VSQTDVLGDLVPHVPDGCGSQNLARMVWSAVRAMLES
jgi:hypothetical protein